MRNHGLLTVGRPVDEALWWFVLMERCCQMQLMTEAIAKPSAIPVDEARSVARQIGTPDFGWFQCQPLLVGILANLEKEVASSIP